VTDLSKKYAKKMEYEGRIRPASAKELGWGYWMINVDLPPSKGSSPCDKILLDRWRWTWD
jgi:hypothetical protein